MADQQASVYPQQPWCGPHKCHPKNCMHLHYPELGDIPEDVEIVLVEREWLALPCKHLIQIEGGIVPLGKVIECECGKYFKYFKEGAETCVRDVTGPINRGERVSDL